MNKAREIIAATLGIAIDRVTDTLSYNSIPEWDSLNHVNLITALEQHYLAEIDEEQMVALTTVRAIEQFAQGAERS